MEQERIIGEQYMDHGLESMMDIAVFNCSPKQLTEWTTGLNFEKRES